MESKHVINLLSVFITIVICQGIYAQESENMEIYYILFEDNEQYVVEKSERKLIPDKINFLYLYSNGYNTPSFIYDKISGEKMSISDEFFKSLSFVDPWEVYIMIAKSEPKPKLFLISKSNCVYIKYEVTISFPPPAPIPKSIE